MKRLLAFAILVAPIQQAVAEPRIACNLNAFTPAERARHRTLIALLKGAIAEKAELPDGYGFRLARETISLEQVAEWAALESKCCPFFDFQLEQGPQPDGPLWLRLRGGEGVKEFVHFEVDQGGPADRRFTCNMAALTKAERRRDAELGRAMSAALAERKELPNGYGFRFAAESAPQLAEWTAIIAKCCQPLDYRLEIGARPAGPLWLWMTGGDGVKEFIGGEFESLLSKEMPR
jgi:hypothetical protein